ncbi:hypothetical protein RHS01_09456 [Rhizoctonia solani]|uniref:Uncharacterized protein n=1 Tax=Rhizoctonia solani TaxID=456999 RepID=A0A8H7M3G3_9AGAM|nr:hypothetical protein RHS01_09456 [Rhizoctonia solani]
MTGPTFYHGWGREEIGAHIAGCPPSCSTVCAHHGVHTLACGFFSFVSVAEAAVNLYRPSLISQRRQLDDCMRQGIECIACDVALGKAAAGALLPVEKLNTVCVPACYTSVSALESQPSDLIPLHPQLKSYRASVATACGTSVVIQGSDATFPITYLADNLLYTYNTTCIKDTQVPPHPIL